MPFVMKVGIYNLPDMNVDVHEWEVHVNWNRVSEWLLFNAMQAQFQPYHGENKLHFNEMNVCFLLD
jgi:hypothetical protein